MLEELRARGRRPRSVAFSIVLEVGVVVWLGVTLGRGHVRSVAFEMVLVLVATVALCWDLVNAWRILRRRGGVDPNTPPVSR